MHYDSYQQRKVAVGIGKGHWPESARAELGRVGTGLAVWGMLAWVGCGQAWEVGVAGGDQRMWWV